MNKVILSGRLAADPKIKTNTKVKVAEFALAVDRPFRNQASRITDFIPCVAFGQRADFAEKFLRKGEKIMVSGFWTIDKWKNRDGNSMTSHKCQVEEYEFCGNKSDRSDLDRPVTSPESDAMPNEMPTQQGIDDFLTIPDDLDDEVPFA